MDNRLLGWKLKGGRWWAKNEEQVVTEVGPGNHMVPYSLEDTYWKDPEDMVRKCLY